MRKDDLRGMTRPQLLEEARRLEIRGRNAMNKEQLVDAVAVTVRPKRERASTPPVVEAGPARKPRKTQGAEPAAPARDAKPGGGAAPHVAGAQPVVRPPDERPPSVAARPLADTPAPSAARPPADMTAPPAVRRPSETSSPSTVRPPAATSSPATARPPADRPHAGMRGHHPPREEEDDDGQNWNSTALGRDPNYGRFLGPGSIPSRNLPPPRRGPGGPPSPVAKSLAERSELGRQRAGERSYGPREDLRRSGMSRRDGAYAPRYERDRRPADPRVEQGRGRVDEHAGRGPQGVRGPQDGGRGGRPPVGPAVDRKGPMEGRSERDGRRSPGEGRPERDDRREIRSIRLRTGIGFLHHQIHLRIVIVLNCSSFLHYVAEFCSRNGSFFDVLQLQAQDGDDGVTVLFHAEQLEAVAAILHLRRRRVRRQPERPFVADEMHFVSATRELRAERGGENSAPANERVAGDTNLQRG
jgi:hypothetical protein